MEKQSVKKKSTKKATKTATKKSPKPKEEIPFNGDDFVKAVEETRDAVKSTKETESLQKEIAELRGLLKQSLSSLAPDIPCKKLNKDAKLPARAHDTDAGMDLFSLEDFELLPQQFEKIDTGISMAIPDGFVGIIKEKSGLANEGIEIKGGVIDSSFRGSIQVMVKLSKGCHKIDNKFVFNPKKKFEKGQKIAQIVILPVALSKVVEVDELPETDRGGSGFGSTGS